LNTRDLKNVEIFNFGASSKKQSMLAKIPKLNCGAGSVSNEEDEYKDSNSYYEFSFDLVALDSLKNISKEDIGLVKIDVEGHELEAFKGMKSLLKKNKPIVLFEQNRGIINGSSNEIEFLKDIGYKHLYELKKIENWITPKFLPKILKSLLQLIEVLILGEPSNKMKLSPISKLSKKTYDMLIFTNERIDI
jgi:FkbM family methyltransferase